MRQDRSYIDSSSQSLRLVPQHFALTLRRTQVRYDDSICHDLHSETSQLIRAVALLKDTDTHDDARRMSRKHHIESCEESTATRNKCNRLSVPDRLSDLLISRTKNSKVSFWSETISLSY